MSNMPASDEPRPADRASGLAILSALLMSLAFMAHHPLPHARTGAEFVTEVSYLAMPNGVVHGSLIALAALLATGYSGLAYRLGLGSLVVRAGLVALAVGTAGWIAAGLLNGFILPAFAMHYAGRPPEELDAMRHILRLGREANQACSKLAVLAMSAAVAFWSIALSRRGFVTTGVAGCVAAVLPAGALLAGHLTMDLHGVMMFLFVQTIWGGIVAVLLIQGRV